MARKTESMLSAVYKTLKAIPDDPRDAAIRAVAKRAAQLADEDRLPAMNTLVLALRELHATPRARGTNRGDRKNAARARRPIDAIRDDLAERRAAREH